MNNYWNHQNYPGYQNPEGQGHAGPENGQPEYTQPDYTQPQCGYGPHGQPDSAQPQYGYAQDGYTQDGQPDYAQPQQDYNVYAQPEYTQQQNAYAGRPQWAPVQEAPPPAFDAPFNPAFNPNPQAMPWDAPQDVYAANDQQLAPYAPQGQQIAFAPQGLQAPQAQAPLVQGFNAGQQTLPGLPPPPDAAQFTPWMTQDAPVQAQATWSHNRPAGPANPFGQSATAEVATRLAQRIPQSRLQAEILRGQNEHVTPFVVSFPIGPVSVGIGAGVTWSRNVTISLRCRDIDNSDEPCYLQYEGRVDRGGQGALGIGSAGFSATVYGGGGNAQTVGFKRRIENYDLRRALYEACLHKQRPSDPGCAWLGEYFAVPDADSAGAFKIGEVWEETQETRYSFGAMFGYSMVQKLDLGTEAAGHFVRRIEKVADDTVHVTLIPVKFRRYNATSGNLLESATVAREESHGTALTYRFNLQNDQGGAAFLGLLNGAIPSDAVTLREAQGQEPYALIGRESVDQTTLRRNLKLLRGKVGIAAADSEAQQHMDTAQASQVVKISSHDANRKKWSTESQDAWKVTGCFDDKLENGQPKRHFQGMLVYQRIALANTGEAKTNAEKLKLQQSRNAQLEALSKKLRHRLPEFNLPQVAGAFGVEVMFALTPENIDQLSNVSEQLVREACLECGVRGDALEDSIATFGTMQAVEAGSHQIATMTPYGQYQVQHVNDSEADREATVVQAEALQLLLRKPKMLQVLTSVLQKIGGLEAPLIDVDCPAYDAAERALDNTDAIRASLITQTDERVLHTALVGLEAAQKALTDALEIASCDSLSPAYDPKTWMQNQQRWRAGLLELAEIATTETFDKRSDKGAQILASHSRLNGNRLDFLTTGLQSMSLSRINEAVTNKPLFDVASLQQRVGLTANAIHAGQDISDNVELLTEAVHDLRKEIETLVKCHEEGIGLGFINRWRHAALLKLLLRIREDDVLRHADTKNKLRREFVKANEKNLYTPAPNLAHKWEDWSDFQVPDAPAANPFQSA